jgi:hypothetical protein
VEEEEEDERATHAACSSRRRGSQKDHLQLPVAIQRGKNREKKGQTDRANMGSKGRRPPRIRNSFELT